MIASFGLTTTIRGQEIDVTLTKAQSVKIIQDLIACDYIQKEIKIILNTIKQKDVIIESKSMEVSDLSREIQKRDDVIDRINSEFELLQKMNQNLRIAFEKESRKRKANKWLYFGLGAAASFGLLQLSK